MSWHRTVRDAIKARIESAGAVGNVYTFERFDKDRRAMEAFFTLQDGSILAWNIRRVRWTEREATPGHSINIDTVWDIRAYKGLTDASSSELDFDDMLDAVAAAFRAETWLCNGTKLLNRDGQVGLQLMSSEPVTLVNALAHGARLELATQSYIEIPDNTVIGPLTDAKVGIAPNIGPAHIGDYKDIANAG
ncbi:hypothetical protein [Kordiimonas marina]|uniref:hypothetical protein n=1 Tax=Kordiimonas marina TaxID=2872312 RepID=UPI001FF5801E|nr:hypothetical protein [Kordiimonas marina]MCJ9428549.1 hypothetical protein [Kordiimonas marina]